ncbi:hypothetical protein K435DRAFT_797796 [Dendrothele bispora CBS 962.96]|uniref:Uncharacterized protein n=1 Tax=Dendrothele bispora (strain CBS 962.96) TaxID=1314807 RepID=A0A4S8M188_DENBC|nr:hypothetical protein K435DRAFT_797796 [Dendrothele bispora CBS 962.96]
MQSNGTFPHFRYPAKPVVTVGTVGHDRTREICLHKLYTITLHEWHCGRARVSKVGSMKVTLALGARLLSQTTIFATAGFTRLELLLRDRSASAKVSSKLTYDLTVTQSVKGEYNALTGKEWMYIVWLLTRMFVACWFCPILTGYLVSPRHTRYA